MPGVANRNNPNYISAHSADVILSDVRPIKLKPEALGAINVLLDEFLHVILTTSRSLTTEKLRSSLLSVLPTSLGKEALLEAEVELRAYWERTESTAPPEDDTLTFHLQWSFELLRLKCSAYSTLNEEDEDPADETRVNEIFTKAHSHSPTVELLDPAALYLTAIIESMCEHILSNVGRVAARDSSRTYATINDLFVALCEDDSIYGFFKTMRVYEQIETMSETPTHKHRSSKSTSRNSSPHLEPASGTASFRSRQSLDGPTARSASRTSGTKTSVEKHRGRESQQAHKRSESIRSEGSEQADEVYIPPEDAALQQREFDDLMRSASTVKMSLTPDRLKTMEAFKLEKDQRGASRRPDAPFPIKPSAAQPTRQQSFRRIKEDEQKKGRRQASVASPSISAFQGIVPTRLRSLSTSGSSWRKPTRSPSLKSSSKVSLTPSSLNPSSSSADMPPTPNVPERNGYPMRTRTKARKRESMDLDDIMNGLDDEPPEKQSPKPPVTPKRSILTSHKVSKSTRELMDFLAEGPPDTPTLSKAGRELVDFLAQGPPDYSLSSISLDKPKGSGRLQKMISRLNLGTDKDKNKAGSDVSNTPPLTKLISRSSSSTLTSLANKPIPPRPPRPPNAPSAFPAFDIPDENKAAMQKTSHEPTSREPSSSIENLGQDSLKVDPLAPLPLVSSSSGQPQAADQPARSSPSSFHTNGPVNGSISPVIPPARKSSQAPRPISKNFVKPGPAITESDARDMQRLFMNATTADECRLILGMFMARNGLQLKSELREVISNSPSLAECTPYTGSEGYLERSLVELFLGGSNSSELGASGSL